jgi:hypothetical protein
MEVFVVWHDRLMSCVVVTDCFRVCVSVYMYVRSDDVV